MMVSEEIAVRINELEKTICRLEMERGIQAGRIERLERAIWRVLGGHPLDDPRVDYPAGLTKATRDMLRKALAHN